MPIGTHYSTSLNRQDRYAQIANGGANRERTPSMMTLSNNLTTNMTGLENLLTLLYTLMQQISGQTFNTPQQPEPQPAPQVTPPLSDAQYDQQFRDNLLKNVGEVGDGWEFSDKLVELPNNALNQPETRQYRDTQGKRQQETVLERNNYWEVVQRGADRHLVMRETDNAGQAVKPSEALQDIFAHRENYQFDCATPMRLLNLKATLDTVGADDFDQHSGRLQLSSWYDQHDNSRFDGGFISSVRTAEAGTINVKDKTNNAGETALFDPGKGDKLTPGNIYYFDLPGDTSSERQGWNAVYLGTGNNGSHQFWSSSIGEVAVNFANSGWIASAGFDDYYLGAAISAPNTDRLRSWDTTRG